MNSQLFMRCPSKVANYVVLKRFLHVATANRVQVIDPPDDPSIKIPQYTARPNECVNVKKARLIYQSRKRGMLENDLLLSTFAAKYLDKFNKEQLDDYDRLINKPSNDWDIFYWSNGVKPTPEEYDNYVMKLLKEHVPISVIGAYWFICCKKQDLVLIKIYGMGEPVTKIMENSENHNVSNDAPHSTPTPTTCQDILEHITTITQMFLLGFLGLIAYFCFCDTVTLFTWHPFLMTFGYVLITSEGILMMRKDNILSKRLSIRLRRRIHWIIQIFAVAIPVAGLTIIVVYKNQHGMSHLKSAHSLIGLNGVITSILTGTGGMSALYNLGLGKYIKPNLVKLVHAGGGLIAYGSAAIAFLLALSKSQWFKSKMTESQRICLGVILFCSMMWVIWRPLWNVLLRIKTFVLDIVDICRSGTDD